MGRSSMRALPLLLLPALSACNPFYVARAAYEESRILFARQPIERVLREATLPGDQLSKLALVVRAREYAESIGLDPGGSFRNYTHTDKDVLSWVVLGSRPDSFTLHTWWFPIVGSVPYKGYFEREDAAREATRLQENGYETSIRGVEAFSTLGWFDDPVLTPLLKHSPSEIANTVIHESVHTTVWLPGHVAFNESLAHYIGLEEAVRFGETLEEPERSQFVAAARERREQNFEASRVISDLHRELSAVYASSLPREEKLKRKHEIFQANIDILRRRCPRVCVLEQPNNAELMQLQLYFTRFDLFRRLYEHSGHTTRQLLKRAEEIVQSIRSGRSQDPFQMMEEMVANTPATSQGDAE